MVTVTNVFCQNKILHYSDLLREIYESQKDSIIHENVIFKDDIGIKNKESFLKYLKELKTIKDSDGLFQVNKNILLQGCVFENDFYLFKTSFNKRVYFDANKFPNKSPNANRLENSAFLILDSCLFSKELLIVSFNKSFPVFKIEVVSCKVNHAFWYLGMSDVNISNSEFTERFKVSVDNNSSIKIDSSSFFLNSKNDSKIDNDLGEITELTSCLIKGDENLVFEILSSSQETTIEGNVFDVNVQTSITQSALTLSKNTFNQKLGLDLSKIEESVFIDMKSLKDLDFGLFIDKHDWGKPLWQYYDGTTHEDIGDEKTFKHYFRVYKILYDYFRLIGDIQSANKAYVRIRELEGRAIKYNYSNNPSFNNFFSLALNRLLKIYTAYGTDPARAILISFYIVMLFGVFYFFFPSDWDVASKSILIEKFKEFIEKNDKGYVKPFFKLLLGFIVSFINAATLSLNAFTTLGFGNIPTHGIARYVCVIQGFIGWFLLSIFTVALINQAQF
jgi:hypothetical protein